MAAGKKVGIVDFTRGELGTRGTPDHPGGRSGGRQQDSGH